MTVYLPLLLAGLRHQLTETNGRARVDIRGNQQPLYICVQVHLLRLKITKDKMKHVEEMHANVCGHAKRSTWITLPAFHIPATTTGNIGQVDIIFGVLISYSDLLAQLKNGRVMTELEDIEDTPSCPLFNFLQFINQVRGRDQGFLAKSRRRQVSIKACMGKMQVIGLHIET